MNHDVQTMRSIIADQLQNNKAKLIKTNSDEAVEVIINLIDEAAAMKPEIEMKYVIDEDAHTVYFGPRTLMERLGE